jgi:hypothetical protein
MTHEERKKEIRKAIELIGWTATFERVKTEEDKTIMKELSQEFKLKFKKRDNAALKKAGISF